MYLPLYIILSVLLLVSTQEQEQTFFVRHFLDPNSEAVENLPAQPKFVRNSEDNKLQTDDRNRPPFMDFVGSEMDSITKTGNKENLLDFKHHNNLSSSGHNGTFLDFPDQKRPISTPFRNNCTNETDPLPPIRLDQSTRERIQHQDRHLQLKAHENAVFGYIPLDTIEPQNSIKMLQMTGEIFKKFCPISVIPSHFVDHVLILFTQLYAHTTPTRLSYLTEEEVNWINKLLDSCQENRTSIRGDFTFNSRCWDYITGDGQGKQICTDPTERFNMDNYDPLLDTIWRIFEVVHSGCFPYFQGYSRIWHRYVMSIYDLFTLPIKQRWRGVVSNKMYFTRLLGPSFPVYSDNIDKCAQYWGNKLPRPLRLPRLFEPFLIRYGPNIPKIFS